MRSAYISVSQDNTAHKKLLFIDNFVLETTSKVNLSMNYYRAPTQGVTFTSVTTTRVQSWFTGVAVAQLVGQVVKWSTRWRFKSQLWLSTMKCPLERHWALMDLAAPCIAAAAHWYKKAWMGEWETIVKCFGAVWSKMWSPSVASLVVWVC